MVRLSRDLIKKINHDVTRIFDGDDIISTSTVQYKDEEKAAIVVMSTDRFYNILKPIFDKLFGSPHTGINEDI